MSSSLPDAQSAGAAVIQIMHIPFTPAAPTMLTQLVRLIVLAPQLAAHTVAHLDQIPLVTEQDLQRLTLVFAERNVHWIIFFSAWGRPASGLADDVGRGSLVLLIASTASRNRAAPGRSFQLGASVMGRSWSG